MGRLVGPRLAQLPLFEKLLHPERIQKMRRFYERRGLLALVVGRFIPFGVRNALFMSTGMSKLPFFTFVLRDALACSLWATVSFSSFYLLGQHLDLLWHYAKTFNLVIFTLFGVAAIACIWYKRRNA
jgi:membrane protein DedA with SNARE-associated domain